MNAGSHPYGTGVRGTLGEQYAEYGAPLYLLVDRMEKTVTLFAGPGRLGYTEVDGPHPFGTSIRIPEPFGIDLDTTGL